MALLATIPHAFFFFSRLSGIFDIVELETERLTHAHSSRFLLSPPRVRYALSLPILGQKAKNLECGLIYIITTLTVLFWGSVRCIMHMCD